MRKYMRVVFDIEIEVTDVTQAAAFMLAAGSDELDNLGVYPYPTDEDQIRAAVNQVVFQALAEAKDAAGFRAMGGGGFIRPVEGDVHPEITLPRSPVRRDDGSYAFGSPER